MWLGERVHSSSIEKPLFNLCCNSGKVRLRPVKGPQQVLRDLLDGNDSESQFSCDNIHELNYDLLFASF